MLQTFKVDNDNIQTKTLCINTKTLKKSLTGCHGRLYNVLTLPIFVGEVLNKYSKIMLFQLVFRRPKARTFACSHGYFHYFTTSLCNLQQLLVCVLVEYNIISIIVCFTEKCAM